MRSGKVWNSKLYIYVFISVHRQEDNVDIVQSLLKEGYVKPEVLGDKKKECNSSSASRNALMSPPPQLEPIEPTSHLPALEPVQFLIRVENCYAHICEKSGNLFVNSVINK